MPTIYLASSSAVKRRAVAQFFNVADAAVVSVPCDSLNLPPQPVGSGLQCKQARMSHLLRTVDTTPYRSSTNSAVPLGRSIHAVAAIESPAGDGAGAEGYLVAIENEVQGCVEVCHASVFALRDDASPAAHGKSQGVPFPEEFLQAACAASTSSEYAHPGLSVTVGAMIHAAHPDVPADDWVGQFGVYSSRVDQIHAALHGALPDGKYVANVLAHQVDVIPDFPRPGILFQDLSTLIAHPQRFDQLVHLAGGALDPLMFNKVVGLDARGFIYGAALAQQCRAGFVMARKKGKLPGTDLLEVEYGTEYSVDTLQMRRGAIGPGDRVIVCDDLVATGGSLRAAVDLVTAAGGVVVGCIVMVAVAPLLPQARAALGGIRIHVVLPPAVNQSVQ